MTADKLTEMTQLLTFGLGNEHFAVDVKQVKEVLEFQEITFIPRSLSFMKGVINVRGSVVPVIDLRLKFGMEEKEITIDTCIIVLELEIDEEQISLGVMVDSVREVIDLESGQIEPAPKFGTSIRDEFIRGIGKRDDMFIIILNINHALSSEELNIIHDIPE